MYEIDAQEYLGHVIRLHPDDDPTSPREWDNLTTLVLSHRRYTLANEVDLDPEDFASREEVAAYLTETYRPKVLLAVAMYDHSALALSAVPVDAIPCGWDVGMVGFVMVTPERQAACGTPDDRLQEVIDGELQAYETYLNGYVVGYTVEGPHCEDSVWGYYTWEDAYEDARANVESAVQAHYRDVFAAQAKAIAPVL